MKQEATLPTYKYQNKAGNTHFILQSKIKASLGQSFLSGLSSLTVSSNTSGTDAAFRKSISEFDFRIILLLESRKQTFVIAVDESFEKIHKVGKCCISNLEALQSEESLEKS